MKNLFKLNRMRFGGVWEKANNIEYPAEMGRTIYKNQDFSINADRYLGFGLKTLPFEAALVYGLTNSTAITGFYTIIGLSAYNYYNANYNQSGLYKVSLLNAEKEVEIRSVDADKNTHRDVYPIEKLKITALPRGYKVTINDELSWLMDKDSIVNEELFKQSFKL